MNTRDHNKFCVLPFIMMNTELTGTVSPCCENRESFGDPRVDGIAGAWNSEKWRQLRATFAQRKLHPSCSYCWNLEAKGVRSYRVDNNMRLGHLLPDLDNPLIYDSNTGEMKARPKVLILKLSNLCNLACRMCVPAISTSVQRAWDEKMVKIANAPMSGLVRSFPDAEQFYTDLESVAPALDQLSFSGGEPFADPQAVRVLERLKPWANSIRLYVNTNLTKLQHGSINLLELMRQYRQKIICVSVDGPPQLHAYIRPGLNSEVFERNLAALQAETSFEIHSNIALQTLNALRFPETLDYVLKTVRPETIVLSIASGSGQEHTDARVLPPKVREAAASRMRRYRDSILSYTWLSEYKKSNALEILDKALGFVESASLHNKENWQRTSDYYKKLDIAHGTSIQASCPELAMFLPSPDLENI